MNLKKNKGFTLIELVVIIAAMAILGMILCSIMRAGGVFYKKSYNTYNGNSEARIIVSYITTKIRQNDASGAINVENNILKIKDGSGKPKYEIFVNRNKLMETEINASGDRKEKEVADLESLERFEITKIQTVIEINIRYKDGNENLKVMNERLTLRSAT